MHDSLDRGSTGSQAATACVDFSAGHGESAQGDWNVVVCTQIYGLVTARAMVSDLDILRFRFLFAIVDFFDFACTHLNRHEQGWDLS